MSDSQLPGVFGQFISGKEVLPRSSHADIDGEVQVWDDDESERWEWENVGKVQEEDYWRPAPPEDNRPVAPTNAEAPAVAQPADHDTILVCLVKRVGGQYLGGQWFANGSSCETPDEILSDFIAQGDHPCEIRWLKINVPKDVIPTVTLPLAVLSLTAQ